MSFELSDSHRVQIDKLAAATGASWDEILDNALSEYRSLLGIDPPSMTLECVDQVPQSPPIADLLPNHSTISASDFSASDFPAMAE